MPKFDKEIFSSECESNPNIKVKGAPSSSASSSASSAKKKHFYYVSSSDEEADTLKDKFWRELEEGKIDVFSNDLYSKIKGTGRSSRPQNFTAMFKDQPLKRAERAVDGASKRRHSTEKPAKTKKPPHSTTQKSKDDNSSEKKVSGRRAKRRSTSQDKKKRRTSKTESDATEEQDSKDNTEGIPVDVDEKPDTPEDTKEDQEITTILNNSNEIEVAMEMVDYDGSQIVNDEIENIKDSGEVMDISPLPIVSSTLYNKLFEFKK